MTEKQAIHLYAGGFMSYLVALTRLMNFRKANGTIKISTTDVMVLSDYADVIRKWGEGIRTMQYPLFLADIDAVLDAIKQFSNRMVFQRKLFVGTVVTVTAANVNETLEKLMKSNESFIQKLQSVPAYSGNLD